MKKLYPEVPSISDLIGRPYVQMNCWQLVRVFYKRVFNIDLNSYVKETPSSRDDINQLIVANMGEFERVDGNARFGDLMLIKIHGIESHIGVYLGYGKFLHSSEKTGSVIEGVEKWERVIVGYFRLKDMPK